MAHALMWDEDEHSLRRHNGRKGQGRRQWMFGLKLLSEACRAGGIGETRAL
jgi:hypothetical protein